MCVSHPPLSLSLSISLSYSFSLSTICNGCNSPEMQRQQQTIAALAMIKFASQLIFMTSIYPVNIYGRNTVGRWYTVIKFWRPDMICYWWPYIRIWVIYQYFSDISNMPRYIYIYINISWFSTHVCVPFERNIVYNKDTKYNIIKEISIFLISNI